MTSFKKFLAPLTAVALVAVMAVSLIGQQRPAEATAEAAQVTNLTSTAPIQAIGLVETYTIGFTTSADGDIVTGGTITTTFPAGFTIPAAPTCTAATGFSAGATIACATVGQVITATVTGTVADATAVTFTIAGITNPATATVFAIGAGPSVVTSGSTTARPSLVALTIWSPSVTAPIQAAGLVETYTATFTTSSSGNLAAGNTVTVVFPAGFTVPTSPTCTFPTGFAGATATCVGTQSSTTPTVVATLTAGTLAVRTSGSIAIEGITNPTAATVFAAGTTAGSIASTPSAARGNGVAMTIWSTVATKSPASGTADGAGSVAVTFTSTAAANTGAAGTTSPVLTVTTDVGTIPTSLSGALLQNITASLTGATQATAGIAQNGGGSAAPLVATIKAPTTAGTSTVLLRATPANGGAAVLLGSTQITWAAATAIAGAAATVTVAPAADTVGNATAQNTVVTARDAAGTLVLNGTVVTATTTNGTFTTCPGGTAGSGVCSGTIQANGATTFSITGAGVSGTQTISATVGSVTSTATVTLTGLATTLELSGRRSNSAASFIAKTVVRSTDSSTTDQDEMIVAGIAKDAAGGVIGSGNVTFTVTGPAGHGVVVQTANEGISSTAVAGTACSVSGTGTTSCTDAIEAKVSGATTASHAFAYIDIDSLAGEPLGTYTVTGSISGAAGATIYGTMTFTLVKAPATITMSAAGTIGLGESKAITITCKGTDGAACPSGTLISVNVTATNLLAQNTSTGSAGTQITDIRTNDAGTATVNLIGVAAGTTQIVINTSTVTLLQSVTVGTGPAAVVTAPGAFVGTVAATGSSIVTFTGTLAQLAATAAEAKAITVTATVGGKFVTHVVGAPAFVNADFAAAFTANLASQPVILVK